VTYATWRHAVAVFIFALCSSYGMRAHAHTPLLSVLSLEERSSGEFIARWESTQGIADVNAAYDLLKPVFPEHCEFRPPRLACGERGLSGRVGFDGLADISTSGLIKIRRTDGSSQTLSLSQTQPHVRLSGARHDTTNLRSVGNFVWVGVTHIWLGLDHLLFVFGLLWLLNSWRVLIKAVTAFTIAHSLTLGAATLGLTGVPVAPVEAIIALSIAFVVLEITREARTKQPSLTRRKPWLVAFAFGLLHGFGFANALSELQIAEADLPLALFGFNVGVELGQLAFIATLLALRPLLRRFERGIGIRLAPIGCYALGGLSMYWFFERVGAFFPGA
jgi:hydrogenase/urease accessory protein HupE